MGNGDIALRSEGKMVSTDTWNNLMAQGAELIKSNFLPSAIKTPAQAIAVILTGRELGIGIMESFRGIDIIENKPAIKPQLMLSLIYNSGVLEDIQINSQENYCEVTMKRKGMSPVPVRFGDEEAAKLNLLYKDNYKKQKKNMYRWRAISACARLVCPDVIGGLYTPEEIESGDYETSIEGAKESLALSEKLNTQPEAYDKWSEEVLTNIMEELETCQDEPQLYTIKKKYETDISRLSDKDRDFIQTNLDSVFQSLVSGKKAKENEKEPIMEALTSPEIPKDELLDKETFGKKWLPKAILEIKDCKTKAQLTKWKHDNEANIGKLLGEQKEYIEAFYKSAINKIETR